MSGSSDIIGSYLSGIDKSIIALKYSVNCIDENMVILDKKIDTIQLEQQFLKQMFNQMAMTLDDFIVKDRKSKALQLAETRSGNLEQELHIKFGHYAEVRRMAIGILQAIDKGMVSQETLKFATEEVLIKNPGYWLAATLITLTSWIRNDKCLASRGIDESLKINDFKTSLFFMLVLRRLNRLKASFMWLDRYFSLQNPRKLNREFIIILEAITSDLFHPTAKMLMHRNLNNWILELTSYSILLPFRVS